MNSYIKASLDAFNVSKNCDRSSVQSFYDSYIERKKIVVTGKLVAIEDEKPVNRKKLAWELTCVKEVTENKAEVLSYIKRLLDNSSTFTTFDKDLIKRALDFVEGVQDEN
jgi:hypothetical protein